MPAQSRRPMAISAIVCTVAAALTIAGAQHGATIGSVPILAIAVSAAFVIQWLVFIPSYRRRTEHFFDLTGSVTYTLLTAALLIMSPNLDLRAWLLGLFVIVWALRLGTFLFRRVRRSGKDDRFDEIIVDGPRFFSVWTIQGLWITLTAFAAWIAISSGHRAPFGWISTIGVVLWICGFTIEVIADQQKSAFKRDPANSGAFISTGLWSRSRHPNYFGEITLWTGILVIAAPALRGWQWIAILSPLFVTLLLMKATGIPLLEKKADKRWGGLPEYERYKESTPLLIPRLKGKD